MIKHVFLRGFFLIGLCFLLGNICYQTLLVSMSDHFNRFADCASGIYQGNAWFYTFQNRILPSLEIAGISKLFTTDWLEATYLYYHWMFIINSFAAAMLCNPLERPVAQTALCVCLFHSCYMLMILAGYWLYAFDLQNQLCLTLALVLFLSKLTKTRKLICLLALVCVWQFTFEEVIYLPLLYLLFWNVQGKLRDIGPRVFLRPLNWVLAGCILASLIVTHVTRSLLSRVPPHAPEHAFLGQGIMLNSNLADFGSELALLFVPSDWRQTYWLQGPGIFLLLNGFAFLFLRPLWRKDAQARAILVLFGLMSMITLTFAHLQEPNTFIPMLLSLFALVMREKTQTEYQYHPTR
jgi:hypothetical protein